MSSDALVEVVGGGIAGMGGTACGYPFDTAKTRLQTPSLGFKGVSDCILRTVQEEGFTALYKGMATPLCTQIVMQGVVFGSYGAAVRVQGRFGRDDKAASTMLVAGATAGLVQAPLFTAIEVVKIRLQVQRDGGGGSSGGGGSGGGGPLREHTAHQRREYPR